jgi:hypothetical protein
MSGLLSLTLRLDLPVDFSPLTPDAVSVSTLALPPKSTDSTFGADSKSAGSGADIGVSGTEIEGALKIHIKFTPP